MKFTFRPVFYLVEMFTISFLLCTAYAMQIGAPWYFWARPFCLAFLCKTFSDYLKQGYEYEKRNKS